MSSAETLQQLVNFAAAREWQQFHSPANLAQSISIEAAELLECFQWGAEGDPADVKGELADVLTYCYYLALALDLDPDTIVQEKLAVTEQKYPVEKARGTAAKYDQL